MWGMPAAGHGRAALHRGVWGRLGPPNKERRENDRKHQDPDKPAERAVFSGGAVSGAQPRNKLMDDGDREYGQKEQRGGAQQQGASFKGRAPRHSFHSVSQDMHPQHAPGTASPPCPR